METVILLGGDARMQAAAEAFRSDGCRADCFWAENQPCPRGAGLRDALRQADALILPVPALTEEGRVRVFCTGPAPSWAELRSCIPQGCLLCGGGIAELHWPRSLDFLEDEDFARANAVPGALALCQHMKKIR